MSSLNKITILTAFLAIIFLLNSNVYAKTLGDALRQGAEHYYIIKADGKIIGYSAHKVSQKMTLAGESFVKIQSLSALRVGMGYIQESLFNTDFTISSVTLSPSYYMLRQISGDTTALSEAVFSKGVIAQKNAVGQAQEDSIVNTDSDCLIYMTNLWGKFDSMPEHYLLLILFAQDNKDIKIPVYDPILKTQGHIRIERDKESVIKVLGKDMKCIVYTMYDFYDIPAMKIWYEPNNVRIARMEEIGGTLTFELSTAKAGEELKKSNGIDLWQNKVALSPIYFHDKSKLNMFSLTANITGRGLSTNEHNIIGFSQSFNGEGTNNNLNGTFLVKKTPVTLDKPNRFPPFNLSDEFKQYLNPQTGIESNNEYIINKSQEITWKSRDSVIAADKICAWIKDNVKSGMSMPSAQTAFLSGTGNPESKAMLMTAMCRAVGLPAKMAGGLIFEKGDFLPGYWCEVYIENNGWLPYNTENGTQGIDSARIYLYEFGDITSLKIENVDFLPQPPKRVSFHQKDIAWPIGEERIFQIRRGEDIIGKEKAIVEDLQYTENGEIYKFKAESTLKLGDSIFTAVSISELDPYALPVSFDSKSGIGNQTQEQKFKFTDKYIEKLVKIDKDNETSVNIPYSKGTYLLDQRYLSLWALVMGQIPRIELGKKYNFTIFIPEEMKTMELELEVKNFERIEAAGKDLNVFKCETQNELIFYIEPTGKVMKISLPAQQLELVLAESDFEIPDKQTQENTTDADGDKKDEQVKNDTKVNNETEVKDTPKPTEEKSAVPTETNKENNDKKPAETK